MVDPREIIDFYRMREPRLTRPFGETLVGVTATNTAHGIGDTVILSALPRAGSLQGTSVSIYSPSEHFDVLCSFNPFFKFKLHTFHVCASSLVFNYDLGNGHFTQRLQRAFGLDPEIVPRGCIVPPPGSTRRDNAVVVHLEAGRWAEWQRARIHPRAREVYPETRQAIQEFIHSRKDLSFFEVGSRSSGLHGVEDWTGLPLAETITKMSGCSYFVGIMSGPMHVAAALGLRMVVIVNFPSAEQICLPTLVDIDLIESEWFYPQSVILHQEGEGRFVKKVSSGNLSRAIDGHLYPYWSSKYLELIREPLG